MNGDIIEREIDRLVFEADGDILLALRMSIAERYMVSGLVSPGFCRVGRRATVRRVQVPPPSIDDPTPGPESQTSAD